MLYAKVVLGLPVDGPFDYLIRPEQEASLSIGSRVWVNFRNKKSVAYIVGLSNKTRIKKLKEIVSVIDSDPILNKPLIALTERIAQYYCCSWGEAIEAALPDELRKGKGIDPVPRQDQGQQEALLSQVPSQLFIQGFDRLPAYLREIKQVLGRRQSVIILCNNILTAEKFRESIQQDLATEVVVVFRKQPQELRVWQKIRQAEYCIVAGTRSGIFSPVHNLGLVIIDQPEDQVYKQEQVPHYHAREVARMRAQIEGAKVILGSHSLSLEGFYLLEKNKINLETIPAKSAYPQIKVIDLRRLAYTDRKSKPLFSKFLLDAIQTVLVEKGRVLLIINRKGFATTVACHNCGAALKCPRCNINLVFHFEADRLECHHCNFKMAVPKICPLCQAGYIKYFGLGTEKVKSELARIFPSARLDQEIVVATGAVNNLEGSHFDLIGVMMADDLLNRVDFQAAEKAFFMLSGIISLTTKKVIIQSANSGHPCFQALIKNDPQFFLKEELKARKQLNFAPFRHMILLKLRGADTDKVRRAAQNLFQRLSKVKTGSLKLLSLHPGQPAKLRGNFYYQILMRAPSVEKASHFLKLHLKERHFSGIIVSIDVDPV